MGGWPEVSSGCTESGTHPATLQQEAAALATGLGCRLLASGLTSWVLAC